jgi:CO/xanthine dehydrogenase FAD-binding subunit
MRPLPKFEFHRPDALDKALELLAELDGARPIAGGTDLLLLLRDGAVTAKHLVDLWGIDELRGIRLVEGEVHIGALTTLNELIKSDIVKENAQVLREAAACVGSVQTRNQGTLAGNLCNASPAADTAPPLLVLDAQLTICSAEGSRNMPLEDFFTGPKMNSIESGELVTEVRFPVPPRCYGASFKKLGRRRGCTLAIVNAAAYIELDAGQCREARLALGAVASTPLRIHEAEAMIEGKRLTDDRIDKVSSACFELVSPIDDIRATAEYRRLIACVLMRRVIIQALEQARRSLG